MGFFNFFAPRRDIGADVETCRQIPGAILLDVRTPEEYAQGHIPGSVNLPLDTVDTISYDRATPLYVYCRSGSRSANACSYLKGSGYRAINIGGITSYHGTLEYGAGGRQP